MSSESTELLGGVLIGDGLFETCRVISGKTFLEDLHISRLRRSGEALGFQPEAIEAGVERIQGFSEHREGLWRVTVVRGGDVSVQHRPLPMRPSPRIMTLRGFYFPGDVLAEHKTLSWIRSAEGLRRARAAGYDEAIRISPEGLVGEACGANVFLLNQQGEWITPEVDGILPGVYRQALLEMSSSYGVRIEERVVREEELLNARALILTSSGRLFQPARELNGRELDQDVCGFTKVILEDCLKG